MSFELDRSKWQRVKFGDVVKNVNENVKDLAASGIERVIGLEHLEPGKLRIDRWGEITPETKFTRSVKPGQTLFGKRRSYQRKTAYAEFDAVCSGDILVFESANPTRLLPELLPFIAMTDGFYNKALETSAGSLSPRTRWSDLAKYEFDLPPLDQQKRIADLLWRCEDRIFSQRDLAGAICNVRDALVNEHAMHTPGLRLSEILERLSDGPFGSKIKSEHYADSPGIRVLRLMDVAVGLTSDRDVAWLDGDYVKQNIQSYRVASSDLLIAGLGDEKNPVGRAASAKFVDGAVHKADIFRGVVKDGAVEMDYLVAMLNSHLVRAQVKSRAQGTTRLRINTANMKKVVVPLGSRSEQATLLEQIERLDRALKSVLEEVSNIEQLRTTVLDELSV